MNLFLYNVFISCYYISIRLAALFGDVKARQWIKGRKNIFQKLSGSRTDNSRLIWFHCASLGEFEQGRPVMERIKMQNSECRIVLTFFSPSGYEVRNNYQGADYIFYLPLDTKQNAEHFLEIIKPDAAYFVKYEYWHHYFRELKEKNIPLYMVSAIFRDDQVFFKWYGKFFRDMLKCVTHFFVQDESSLQRINSLGFNNAAVTGDTRFDRVSKIAEAKKEIPLIEKFTAGKRILVAGSTWLPDEILISKLSLANFNIKLVIAPHDISESRVNSIVTIFEGKYKVARYSSTNEVNIAGADILIIDSIGMLSSIYRYGWANYIGGGFEKGIHNILEAAVYGKPVFFGPNYRKAAEAIQLIRAGGAFSVNKVEDLQYKLNHFHYDEASYQASCEASKKFVSSNTGATEKIIQATAKIASTN